MADIKQAARWLQEGKPIKRFNSTYVMHSHSLRADAVIFHSNGFRQVDTAAFLIDDLLAEDWELATTQSTPESRKQTVTPEDGAGEQSAQTDPTQHERD